MYYYLFVLSLLFSRINPAVNMQERTSFVNRHDAT